MNEDHSTEGKPQQKLWTRDFTIITLGSVVSMVGGTMTGFAISIMVLDYTGSTFLYALFNICFQIPMLVCPLLAGPVLDRMSRKKVIYSLDAVPWQLLQSEPRLCHESGTDGHCPALHELHFEL